MVDPAFPRNVSLPSHGLTTKIVDKLNGEGFHIELDDYDNDGADVNEGVEVAGPAGTDLTGWKVIFYNGNGQTYALFVVMYFVAIH